MELDKFITYLKSIKQTYPELELETIINALILKTLMDMKARSK